MPYSEALYQQMVNYCSANQLGDWAYGVDPLDTSQYGGAPGGEGSSESSGATDQQNADIRAQCEAKAQNADNASSGAIQYCYMEYGIEIRPGS